MPDEYPAREAAVPTTLRLPRSAITKRGKHSRNGRSSKLVGSLVETTAMTSSPSRASSSVIVFTAVRGARRTGTTTDISTSVIAAGRASSPVASPASRLRRVAPSLRADSLLRKQARNPLAAGRPRRGRGPPGLPCPNQRGGSWFAALPGLRHSGIRTDESVRGKRGRSRHVADDQSGGVPQASRFIACPAVMSRTLGPRPRKGGADSPRFHASLARPFASLRHESENS